MNTTICPAKKNPELLVDYAAGRLAPAERRMVEDHAAQCTPCQDQLAGQVALWKVLDQMEAAPVSADFDRRLFARMAAERDASWWQRTVRWMLTWELPFAMRPAAALSLAGVLAMGLFLYQPGQEAGRVGTPATVESAATADNPDVESLEQALEDLELLQTASL